MELQLAITNDEVLHYQRDYRKYICDYPSVRQSELSWVVENIVGTLSKATSQKCGWAVSATIKPGVVSGLSHFNLSREPAKVLRDAELACKKSS
jgi:hypothetical protein